MSRGDEKPLLANAGRGFERLTPGGAIMRSIILMLAAIVAVGTARAQIPNHGFEDWRTIAQHIGPEVWNSATSLFDSSGTYTPVTRSSDHYPPSIGSYSVRISNDTSRWKNLSPPAAFLGWGFLTSAGVDDRPLFPVHGHPTTLRGYYKFEPQNDDTLNISVFLYKNGVEIAMGKFQSSVPQAVWTSFTVPIGAYSEADSGRITLAASNEPKNETSGPRGNSVLYVDNISFDSLIVSGIPPGEQTVPDRAELLPNYPNPFNPETRVVWIMDQRGATNVTVHDLLGRVVSVLADGDFGPGPHEVVFRSHVSDGGASTGVYLCRLTAGGRTQVRTMVLLK